MTTTGSDQNKAPGSTGGAVGMNVRDSIRQPLWLLAELTYACPLQCPYCSNPMDFASVKKELTTEEWINVFRQAREMGATQLGLSGGEPLTRPDLIELIREARNLGFYTNLITSGVGLNADKAKEFKEAGLDHIQVSFQASSEDLNNQIACVIIEPVAGNMNCIPPVPGFLQGLREICDEYGAVLIFDEVMTGFRVALGGAQAHYNITPDLTTFGKIIGGGLPVGAFGGKREMMEHIAPLGPVYQAGTLSGNPIAMAAGLTTLKLIQASGFHDALTKTTETLVSGLQELADKAGIPMTTNQVGGMFGLFFTEDSQVNYYEQVVACDQERFKHFFHLMLNNSVYLAPSAFEAGFVSAAHGEQEIEHTLSAAKAAFAAL